VGVAERVVGAATAIRVVAATAGATAIRSVAATPAGAVTERNAAAAAAVVNYLANIYNLSVIIYI
jgi:hypothetical protein